MNLRVNLLRDTEIRHVGVVSRAFIIRLAVIAASALLALFVIMQVGRYKIVTAELATSQDRWTQIKPMYDRSRVVQQQLADRKKLLGELTEWNHSRIEWTPALAELQEIVPPTIQLTKLMSRSELTMKEAKVVVLPSGIVAKPASNAPPASIQRLFSVSLFGKASGTLADQVVLHFVRTYQQAPVFQTILDSVKLQSMQRDSAKPDEQADRSFQIEATCKPRAMK